MHSCQALEVYRMRSHMLQNLRRSDGSMPARAAVDDHGHGGCVCVAATPFAKDGHELAMHIGQPAGGIMARDHPRNYFWMSAIVI